MTALTPFEKRRELLIARYAGAMDGGTASTLAYAAIEPRIIDRWLSTSAGGPAITFADAHFLPDLLHARVSRRRATLWRALGVNRAQVLLDLHRRGAHPDAAEGFLQHSQHLATTLQYWLITLFVTEYRNATDQGVPPAMANAVLSCGGNWVTAQAWHRLADFGVTPERAALFVLAGVTPTEIGANPDLLRADLEHLAALAALRGHEVSLPLRLPGQRRPRPAHTGT